jgi:hypothetical protein
VCARLSGVQITANRVAVEAYRLKPAQDHVEVLLAEVLFAVPANRDDTAGFVAQGPVLVALAPSSAKP